MDDLVKSKIHTIRNTQVILDSDLAELYEVKTKVLNQAVKRNIERFPENFCFTLTNIEFLDLRYQFVTSNLNDALRFQNGTLKLNDSLRSQFVNLEINKFLRLQKVILLRHNFVLFLSFSRFNPKSLYITYCNNIITKMNNIKILKYLLQNKESQFTINQISKDLSINYRIAHTQIKLLEKENLIQLQKAGKSLLCSLTNNFNEKIFLAEYERLKELLENKDFKLILQRYSKAKQNYVLLLFGSYAKNQNNKFSDIDLLAITNDSKEIEEITKLIPRNIHLTAVTYQDFLNMKNSKELSIANEAIKNNIILIGIDEYYRLINNDS